MPRRRITTTVPVPVGDLTDHQLLVVIFQRIEGLETAMQTLQEAVADLGAAVTDVSGRLAGQLAEAQQVAADALARAQALQADDDADKAAIVDANQRVLDLLSQSSDAAAQIESKVAVLNSLGQGTPADGGGDVPPAGGGDTPPADGGDVPAGGGDTPPPADGGGDTPADGTV